MEEELNENDLEERLYAMLHHVDESEVNTTSDQQQSDGLHIVENTPKSTVRRYWRTSEPPTQYQKVNTPKQPTNTSLNNYKQTESKHLNQTPMPKEEKLPCVELSILQSPVSQNIKRTIEIIEHDVEDRIVLESSDEDEVIEVAVPPKPTITIESSDEDELTIINPSTPPKNQTNVGTKAVSSTERESSSPAPSVVSSVSDEFIRGDCIALNISSRHPDNPSFDFSLHGSDLLGQSTPSKKRKKKPKQAVTSTPVVTVIPAKATSNDTCFATPKSKAKNKKQKTKGYSTTEKSIPNADVYDSDSNNSIDINKSKDSYVVTEKSLPSIDVYESDSNMSEGAKEVPIQNQHGKNVSSDSSCSPVRGFEESLAMANRRQAARKQEMFEKLYTFNQTESDRYHSTLANNKNKDSDISENIVIGNVSGLTELEPIGDRSLSESDISKFVSTKIPAILNEDLDFDNLKGKENICTKRRYSLTTLRAEMQKFYNESWGGENFNHREIQKSMSRDKSLWMIDPKDRLPPLSSHRPQCNYCNRAHRTDMCIRKPLICHICGRTGHTAVHCPTKICFNCGSASHVFTTLCHVCCGWRSLQCGECGQRGHPAPHCPDRWRRYHGTIDNNAPLERCYQMKSQHQLYCSGCSRRGHLLYTCRSTIPFNNYPDTSPFVFSYRPIYPPTPNTPNTQQKKPNKNLSQDYSSPTASTQFGSERNKRQSKSPMTHDAHMNKKRLTMSPCEETERRNTNTKSPNTPQRLSTSKDEESKKEQNKSLSDTPKSQGGAKKAPNFIPLVSPNHDKKGNMIQDNEVSDTSDVITSARIYITNDIIDKLKTDEGKLWLNGTAQKCSVEVEDVEITSFLSIRGKLEDQEAFQSELRDWAKPPTSIPSLKPNTEGDVQGINVDHYVSVIPKNRNNLLRQLSKALESLKEDLGDPSALYKELKYLQNRQQNLLKQKIVNPKQVTNNRGHINQMQKRLNMVLLGQAGLADGSEHLSELYSLQEKLMNSRQKNIPTELRKEIGHHYTIIFTSLPRNDYIDLLKMYHTSKQKSLLLKKKKKKSLKVKPTVNRLQKINGIPTHTIENGGDNEPQVVMQKVPFNKNTGLMHRLTFYHKRLLSARPTGAVHKKTRLALARKLHSFIASMVKKENIPSKVWRKIRKTQEQAQVFLSSV